MRYLILAAALFSAGQAGATCIRDSDVLATDRPNDKTVIFYMKDKSVWRNTMPVMCPNLSHSVDGFTVMPTDINTSDICDGLATIRLNDEGHATCILGTFTELKGPA